VATGNVLCGWGEDPEGEERFGDFSKSNTIRKAVKWAKNVLSLTKLKSESLGMRARRTSILTFVG
jgi:hypothetical protein